MQIMQMWYNIYTRCGVKVQLSRTFWAFNSCPYQ